MMSTFFHGRLQGSGRKIIVAGPLPNPERRENGGRGKMDVTGMDECAMMRSNNHSSPDGQIGCGLHEVSRSFRVRSEAKAQAGHATPAERQGRIQKSPAPQRA